MFIFSLLLAALVAGSAAYSVLVLLAVRSYLSAARSKADGTEPVSVLKPLAGREETLEENLRTFFEQDHPEFELIFAVHSPADPAREVVERLQRRYPTVRSRLITTGEPPYPNAKAFNLARMMEVARYELVVMSDSDIGASSDLLRRLAAEFGDKRLGLVTCPYRAVPGNSFWSRLEALGLNTDFMAGLLAARLIEGVRFAVGPTIAARRRAVEDAGGIDSLGKYLAEDFVLGARVAATRWKVELSHQVVDHYIGNSTFSANLRHRLRWVRSTRRSRPAGYVGQIFTYPLPLCLAAALWAPSWWPFLVAVAGLRMAAAATVALRVLNDPLFKKRWWCLPFEDLISFCFWAAGFFGNEVQWRGRSYRLLADGTGEEITAARTPGRPML